MAKFLNITGVSALLSQLKQKLASSSEVADIQSETETYVTNVDYSQISFDTSEIVTETACYLVLNNDHYGDLLVDYTYNGKEVQGLVAPAGTYRTSSLDYYTTTIIVDCGSLITFTHTKSSESIYFTTMYYWEKVSEDETGNTRTFRTPSTPGTYSLTFDHS